MKRFFTLLCTICLCLLAAAVPAHAAEADPELTDNANSWRYADGQWLGQNAVQRRYTAYHPDATLMGIDVSSWQGKIDWAAVKADGIDFAILRCGYGMDQTDQDDTTFLYNAQECERLDIPYGVYLYSYADSVTRADSEADHVLRLLQGRSPTLPVYYDMEDDSTLGKNVDLAAIATTFCSKIEAAGYPVGVYANLYWWNDILTDPCFDNWHRWVAQYNSTCGYTGDFAMWQFSSTGAVDGIQGNVDMNYLIDYPDDHQVIPGYSLIRLSGPSRYDTANAIGTALKTELGGEQFDTVIVASGNDFPDALAGSYLAAVKNAPLLITSGKDGDGAGSLSSVQSYIKRHLKAGGTVYILGGDAAVPLTMEKGLTGYKVERLSGKTRYETNLAILNEAGVAGQDILVVSGTGFADSLSASATGLPILQVGDTLTEEQKQLLGRGSGSYIIIGGDAAVSPEVESQLRAMSDKVCRLSGKTRYETSAVVANFFFPDTDTMVLASGLNFPDGLSGGPLAYELGAPLLLVQEGQEAKAAEYRLVRAVKRGIILGGDAAVSDATVNKVFPAE